MEQRELAWPNQAVMPGPSASGSILVETERAYFSELYWDVF